MKKLILFLLIYLAYNFINYCYSQNENIPVIKSSKKTISYWINNKHGNWSISPEISPDRLEVFCPNEKKTVCFKTDKDSISFLVGANDTIRFFIFFNNKEKALTEIVGFNRLPNKISETEKLYYLSLFWSEAKYNFVSMDRINFSWDSLYQTYIPKVIQSSNDYEYFQLLKEFAASLKDGHTQISDNGQFYLFQDYVPINFKEFNDKIYIVSIKKGIGLDSTFIGAELLSISSIPINKYLIDSVYPFISASTKQHLKMQGVYKLHSNFITKSFNAKVKKNSGEISTINISFNGEATRSVHDERWGRIPPQSSNIIIEYEILQENIAYLSINSFQDDAISLISKKINNINKSKGLIIDLRKNGGGSTDVAWYLQSVLTKDSYFLNYAWQTRINDGVKKANGNWIEEYKDFFNNIAVRTENPDTVFISDTIQRIKVPVLILIGNYTFSAAEDFLVNIYEIPNRPMLIGEETGGSTGSPLVIPMPNNGYGRICTRRVCFPYSKKPFINQGIIPDIIITQSLNEYLKGRDIVLEKALEILSSK